MSVRRWTINLSMNPPRRTLNHGPPPVTKNVGQQHVSRTLYSGVGYKIKMDIIITHRRVNPRTFHARVVGLPLSFQFEKQERQWRASAYLQCDDAIRVLALREPSALQNGASGACAVLRSARYGISLSDEHHQMRNTIFFGHFLRTSADG